MCLPAASRGCRASEGKSVERSVSNSPCSFLTLLFGSSESRGQGRFSESMHFLSRNVKCLDEAEDDSGEKARLLVTTFWSGWSRDLVLTAGQAGGCRSSQPGPEGWPPALSAPPDVSLPLCSHVLPGRPGVLQPPRRPQLQGLPDRVLLTSADTSRLPCPPGHMPLWRSWKAWAQHGWGGRSPCRWREPWS